MDGVITFLSAGVPGGIFLFIFVLFSLNLTLYFLKKSELISHSGWKKNMLTFNLVVLLLYVALWFVTQPPKPQERIIVLPTRQSDKLLLNARAFSLAESFQKAAREQLKDRYLLHRWQWLFETIPPQKRVNYASWQKTARALKPRFLISSNNDGIKLVCLVNDLVEKKSFQISVPADRALSGLLPKLNERLHLFKELAAIPPIDNQLLEAQIALLEKDYEKVLQLLQSRQDVEALAILAAVYVEKGLAIDVDQERAKYVPIKNPDFEKAKKILRPIILNRKDTPQIDLLMGRLLIREREYTTAEMFLKKAYVQDPENCRVHFSLSFLLPDRLKDIGYQSRVAILKRAVVLDPGYRDAVYQLANEIYLSGRGTLGSIQEAIDIINRFLEIHPDDPEMMSLLGSLYIKTNHPEKALPIFKDLFNKFPDDSDSYYNLGVCYYMLKKDSTALRYFRKAIQMDQHLDSYLYIGMIYKKMGQADSALKYFRERVARKTGDDDAYAKEAMLGIRQILIQQWKEKHGAKADSSQ
ncbi:MAG TPA: tetratricopeptide repeat protein [Caldithrix abyssi]|uniref:Tetratricopeptide repeat protein n=1 Tax=Caldithrix abyssi TaxID=187145 RepID=A0A7V5LIZ9_CALAY|nr:tetratricopeptide repeat protein [Caldisericaceae bacterium]HHE55242.1 tetratricopeptide repeat protein [Caldithrix abyssi]